MKHECEELKAKILDQSIQEIMEEIMKHVASKEDLKELKRAFDSFNSRHKKLEKRPTIFEHHRYVKLIYPFIAN